MYPYQSQFQELLQRLAATSRIELLQQDCVFPPQAQIPQHIISAAQYMKESMGIALPEEDWPLCYLPATMDIAWITQPGAVLPAGIEELGGCISLIEMSDSLYIHKYHLDKINPSFPAFAHCSYFETGGAEDFDYRTFLHFVPGQGQAPDVRLFDRPDVLPLTTSVGEYVRAALAWHGAYGWQFLYLPLDEFKALHPVTRQKAYALAKVLPDLFPDADWSVIETKRAYFDTEHA